MADVVMPLARRLGCDLLILPQDRRQFELTQMMTTSSTSNATSPLLKRTEPSAPRR
jgi:hypothetical protein